MTRATILAPLAALLLVGCGGPKECDLADPKSCADDQVCEQVTGREKPLCFAPVTLEGKVFDLSTAAGIADAEVLATDENGAPAGAATRTASDGTYSLRVPSTRTDEKGAFESRKVLLRSQAKNYLPFPSGARVSLPIDTSAATRKENSEDPFVLKSPLTAIGLSPVEASQQNLASVSGTVELSAGQKSVMVVLESGTPPGRTTLAGADGKFVFFNVPAGNWKASAYTKGVNYTPADVTVAAADVTVELKKSTVTPASLSGSVQLVAGANGAGTSVVLVVESTFIESLGRGEVPPGLRAPDPGVLPNITGSWTISGIPDGKYVVLAAFENDGNVRDPDPGIAGTGIQRITVANGTISGATAPQFKVTGAVGLVSPGAEGPEDVTGTPTFTWVKYSNADAYLLRVYNSLGEQLWEKPIADAQTVSTTYAGPALTAGQYYQWRLTAIRRLAPTSMTEELRGIFRVQ